MVLICKLLCIIYKGQSSYTSVEPLLLKTGVDNKACWKAARMPAVSFTPVLEPCCLPSVFPACACIYCLKLKK